MSSSSYYQYHVFFCTNQREAGESCCANHGSVEMRDYAKNRIKELQLHKNNQVRINTAGCLNRCAQGPVLVVYPEDTWYTWSSQADIDEIISEHLCHGRPVKRLQISHED